MSKVLESIRAEYPQYNDIDDDTLVTALHQKFRPDVNLGTFQNEIGYSKPRPQDPELAKRPELFTPKAPLTHEERRLQERSALPDSPQATLQREEYALDFAKGTPKTFGEAMGRIKDTGKAIGTIVAGAPALVAAGAIAPVKGFVDEISGGREIDELLAGSVREGQLMKEGMTRAEARVQSAKEGYPSQIGPETSMKGFFQKSNQAFEDVMGVPSELLIKTPAQAKALEEIGKPLEILFDVPATWLENKLADATGNPEMAKFIRNEMEAATVVVGPKVAAKFKGKVKSASAKRAMKKAQVAEFKKRVAKDIELQRGLPPQMEAVFAKDRKAKAMRGVPETLPSSQAADLLGSRATTANIRGLRQKSNKLAEASTELREAGRLQEAMDVATQSQFFREAAETAEARVGTDFNKKFSVKNESEYRKALIDLPDMFTREDAVKFGSLYANEKSVAALKRRVMEVGKEIDNLEAKGVSGPALEHKQWTEVLMEDAIEAYEGRTSVWDIKPETKGTFQTPQEAKAHIAYLPDGDYYVARQVVPGEVQVVKRDKPSSINAVDTPFIKDRSDFGIPSKSLEEAAKLREMGRKRQLEQYEIEGAQRVKEAELEKIQAQNARLREQRELADIGEDVQALEAPVQFGDIADLGRLQESGVSPDVALGGGGAFEAADAAAARRNISVPGFEKRQPAQIANTKEVVKASAGKIQEAQMKSRAGMQLTPEESALQKEFSKYVVDIAGGHAIKIANKFKNSSMSPAEIAAIDQSAVASLYLNLHKVDANASPGQIVNFMKRTIEGEIKNEISVARSLTSTRHQVAKAGGEQTPLTSRAESIDAIVREGRDPVEGGGSLEGRLEMGETEAIPEMTSRFSAGKQSGMEAERGLVKQQAKQFQKEVRDTFSEIAETLNPEQQLVAKHRILAKMRGEETITTAQMADILNANRRRTGKKELAPGSAVKTVKRAENAILKKMREDIDMIDLMQDLEYDFGGTLRAEKSELQQARKFKKSKGKTAGENRAYGKNGIEKTAVRQAVMLQEKIDKKTYKSLHDGDFEIVSKDGDTTTVKDTSGRLIKISTKAAGLFLMMNIDKFMEEK